MANSSQLPTEGCETKILAPETPCATRNLCVQQIDARIYRMVQELVAQTSGRVTGFTADDKTRIDQFYSNLLRFIEDVGNTVSDWKFFIEYKLEDIADVVINVQNETINSAVMYLVAADINLRSSQSTNINDGLLPTEKTDLVDAVNKSQTIVNSFFAENPYIDAPNSFANLPNGD